MESHDSLLKEATSEITQCADLQLLRQLQVDYLGKKGKVSALLRTLGKCPPEDRQALGAEINRIKQEILASIDTKQAELDNWKREILLYFSELLLKEQPTTNPITSPTNPLAPNLDPLNLKPNDKNDLQTIHKNFIIGYQDKFARNYSFICKKYVLQLLTEEVNSPTYQKVTEDIEQIHNDVNDKMSSLQIPPPTKTHK